MERNNTYFERMCYQKGFFHIAGVDEVGRGCLAGPVIAAACILPKGYFDAAIKDSKALSADQREAAFNALIKAQAIYGIGIVSNIEIDKINILQATHLAMRIAITNLAIVPDYILIDGNQLPSISISHRGIIKGDQKSLSIAAASIIAKVTRDNLMQEYDKIYPMYYFAENKGYPTKKHIMGLDQFGPCAIHRLSYKPVTIRNSSCTHIKQPTESVGQL